MRPQGLIVNNKISGKMINNGLGSHAILVAKWYRHNN